MTEKSIIITTEPDNKLDLVKDRLYMYKESEYNIYTQRWEHLLIECWTI